MPKEITATIISIGDELLIGQTINTNAGWMGEQLALSGIRSKRVLTIGDDKQEIVEALDDAITDIVLITGGLGPTKDDITKHTLCEYFDTELVRHPEIEAQINAFFEQMGRDPLEVNRAQADLPAACTVIPNDRGTASGMWFKKDGKVYVSMPGVPYEMKAMMQATVIPMLRDEFLPPAIVHRTILTTGMGESYLAERIAKWEDGLAQHGIKLAYLPSPGLVKLRLSAYASDDPSEARKRVDEQATVLYKEIPELIFGEGDDTLQAAVGKILKEQGKTLSTAESCTGGYVSHLITSVPGSSAYFTGGVVSYANAVKMEELGIPADMLKLEGAVSKPVVEKMASGVREALKTDWSIAISGVAGPDGGTPEKPVGTVWIAVAGPDGVVSKMGQFSGTRGLVIKRSGYAALGMLRKELLG
ncbi:MAG: competence/damage-inducible protein A [Flavobacteriales bacterium]|nr:competence/damage-inducible protein A [Flavobacteriales bacterium]MBK6945070.1 competence/damage-inducible protein A [Flavobacteriales bacterium]MBK7239418.1 competence/damage-inducible protein A [Flavobacteriales bacterium]MBK7295951.1 competence/damage-inducible protein A [Flavobacteriales bacterium]MBK9535374.1 competence/damage-inducible protein A [Flavobacteriales bacterium]